MSVACSTSLLTHKRNLRTGAYRFEREHSVEEGAHVGRRPAPLLGRMLLSTAAACRLRQGDELLYSCISEPVLACLSSSSRRRHGGGNRSEIIAEAAPRPCNGCTTHAAAVHDARIAFRELAAHVLEQVPRHGRGRLRRGHAQIARTEAYISPPAWDAHLASSYGRLTSAALPPVSDVVPAVVSSSKSMCRACEQSHTSWASGFVCCHCRPHAPSCPTRCRRRTPP